MRRRALVACTVLSVLLVPAGVAAAASGDRTPPDLPAQAAGAGPVEGDRDGDNISDDFEAALRGADAGKRVKVIVTGLDSRQGRRAVGAFALKHELSLIDGFAATMTAAQARALARAPGVRRVEADGTVHAFDDATDRDFGAAAARAGMPGLDGTGVGICVIDTGIDPAHEQIAPRAVVFTDYVNGRAGAYDDHGHGTHVAAIAAGDGVGGSDAATFSGVAPAANLWAAKVLNSAGSGADSDVAAAVQWCHEETGVHVLSLSLGSPGTDGSDAVSLAVNRAATGADGRSPDVVVVAAGNSGDAPGTVSAPGVAAHAVTVGAVADHSAPAGTERHDDGIWLAAFSSRGPTLSGLTKPDIAAPGVTVTAAQAGTVSGYVTFSGTSMATPYVAGAAALGLDAAAPGTSADEVRTALLASALDVGAPGSDNEWGAGLVDVLAFVDRLASEELGSTAFPTSQHSSGLVPDGGYVVREITVPADGTDVPLVAMVTQTDGVWACDFLCAIGWSAGDWTPDLDIELRDPSGNVVAVSECSLAGVDCRSGRQETVAVGSPVPGTYTLRVFAWPAGSGAGGPFDLDVFHGPLSGVPITEPPPEEVPNQPPTADAGPDQTVKIAKKTGVASFTLDGRASSDTDGTVESYRWTDTAGSQVGTEAAFSLTASAVGDHVYTLVVTDDDGAVSEPDSVVVTVTGSTGGGGGGGKPPRR